MHCHAFPVQLDAAGGQYILGLAIQEVLIVEQSERKSSEAILHTQALCWKDTRLLNLIFHNDAKKCDVFWEIYLDFSVYVFIT